MDYNKINSMLQQIYEPSFFLSFNVKYISDTFGSLNYRNQEGKTILHILADKKYDEKKSFLAIKSLLQYGFDPNEVDINNYNFIQTALENRCSNEFVLKIINEALKYNLDVNHVNNANETIMHIAIYNKNDKEEISNIFDLLLTNGFDVTKVDGKGQNILNVALSLKNCSMKELKKVEDAILQKSKNESLKNSKYSELGKIIQKFENDMNIVDQSTVEINQPEESKKKSGNNEPYNQEKSNMLLTSAQIKELEKYGRVLNMCEYKVAPTIAREKELRNLMITLAQELESPIIVGDSGVGKTALVHELVYRIQRGEVPKFLKDRIILEINPGQVVDGCKYVGEFEQSMNKLIGLCKKYNVIAFIDEIHSIYGVGSSDGKKYDMAQMLKYYIDRNTFKVIGATTTEEYQQYLKNDALKRRFEKIIIKEPENDVLKQIINKVLDDYCLKKQIKFKNENIKTKVIDALLDITQSKNRVFDDKLNNPALAISIIDKAFGIACTFDCEFITLEHFIESIDFNYRIYDTAKQKVKNKLQDNNIISSEKPKVLQFVPKKK